METSLAAIVLIALCGFAIGFGAGYGARAYRSYRRRQRRAVWPRESLI